MTDRITEHYQENPEGARLVSDEDIRGGQNRQAPGKKSAGSAAGKPEKAGKPDKSANPSNPSKTDKSTKSTKTAKSAKSAKPVKSGKADGAEKAGASKQAKPGKSAGSDKSGKPAKKAENPAEYDESGEQSQSVKTPSVMRLVEERAFSENQVVAAGKSLIPRQLRGIEPLSKVMRREAELQRGEQPDDEVSRSPLVMRELTEMVIAENVPGIIRRFNACDCEKCMSELARLTAEEIPARYMKMPELADLNWSGFSSDERMLIDSLKKNAVTVMIRIMIANKKRNFH
ncbi:MAG TPA: hypothetical protein DHW32_04345 [Ruminococcaceae bacterium]|nr:hypothetical protein [Oscillospiraceae bacterium]HCK49945.1 hypothetical protein [Oscillospiraceae bacterium]